MLRRFFCVAIAACFLSYSAPLFSQESESEIDAELESLEAEFADSAAEEDFAEDASEEGFAEDSLEQELADEGGEELQDIEDEFADELDPEAEQMAEQPPVDEFEQVEPLSQEELEQLAEEEPFAEDLIVDEPPQEDLPPAESIAEPESLPAIEEPLGPPQEELVAQTPEVDSGPDLQYEAQLYNIYLNYHSSPMSDEDWVNIIGEKSGEVYTIQKRDTLWDLSQTFFGDGNYWPKIWSVNSEITNPHLIKERNAIRFILGTEDEVPAFAVTEPDAEVLEPEQESYEIANEEMGIGGDEETLLEEVPEEVVIPASSIIIRPVPRNLPPSLPKWKTLAEEVEDSLVLDVEKVERKQTPYIRTLGSFVEEGKVESLGKIFEVEGSFDFAGLYQYAYVKSPKGKLKIGQRYLAIQNKGPVMYENDEIDEAQVYQVQGEVEVVERVEIIESERDSDLDYFKVFIKKLVNEVTVGADLTSGQIKEYAINKEGTPAGITSQIIGGERDTKRSFLSHENIVYLNRGSVSGLQEGMILPIYRKRQVDNDDSIILKDNFKIGNIKVVRITPNFSTAIIIDASENIRVGDYTGKFISNVDDIVEEIEPLKLEDEQLSELDSGEEGLEYSEGLEEFEQDLEKEAENSMGIGEDEELSEEFFND